MSQKKIKNKSIIRKTKSIHNKTEYKSFTKYILKNIRITLKYSFLIYVSLHFLIPIVLYAWPNIMNHMIFQSFSNFFKFVLSDKVLHIQIKYIYLLKIYQIHPILV